MYIGYTGTLRLFDEFPGSDDDDDERAGWESV